MFYQNGFYYTINGMIFLRNTVYIYIYIYIKKVNSAQNIDVTRLYVGLTESKLLEKPVWL